MLSSSLVVVHFQFFPKQFKSINPVFIDHFASKRQFGSSNLNRTDFQQSTSIASFENHINHAIFLIFIILSYGLIESEITYILIIGSAGTLVMIAGFITIVVLYQRNQIRQRDKLHRMRMEEQRKVMRASLESQEIERTRIARDLHDQVGGTLSGLKLALTSIPKIEGQSQMLTEINGQLKDCIQTVRQISHDLLPPILAKFGLSEAIRELLVSHGKLFDWETSFDSQIEQRSDEFIEKELYRVVNELLNNLGKHGRAKNVEIHLDRFDNESIRIKITDNGVPFDFNSALKNSEKSLGLYNIKARLGSLKATINAERVENKNITSIVTPLQTPPG